MSMWRLGCGAEKEEYGPTVTWSGKNRYSVEGVKSGRVPLSGTTSKIKRRKKKKKS